MSITKRIDAITEIPPRMRGSFLPAPKSVKIELTGRCNYRCGFCALRMRERQPRGDMDFDLFRRITTEMREAGVEEIGCFFLGESMMAPKLLVNAIRWCKEIGFPYVFLTTNGSLAKPKVVQEMMEAGLDSLKFSVNNFDEKQFVDIVQVKERWFYEALGNIRKAHDVRRRGGYQTKIYASSIRYDGEQQAKMEKLLEDYVLPYVDEHYWLPLYSMGAFATQREEELGYRPIAGNQGRLDCLRDPLPCWSAFTEGHVRADGGLSACCFDASGEWLMGDLTKDSFMNAWNSKKFQDLRRAHLEQDVTGTVCEKCVAYS